MRIIIKNNPLKILLKNKEIKKLVKIKIDENVARVDSAIVDKSKIQ